MFNFIKLNCPTCGASLSVDKNSTHFACEHYGNNYVLENKARDLKWAEREHLLPLTTSTRQLKQWLKVGTYEIFLHEVQELRDKAHFFCANVEYRNTGSESLNCRRNQWLLYDSDSYSYEGDPFAKLPDSLNGKLLGGDRTLTPGSHLRGWVVFELSKSATVGRLQFITSLISTKTAEFIFK